MGELDVGAEVGCYFGNIIWEDKEDVIEHEYNGFIGKGPFLCFMGMFHTNFVETQLR